MSWNKMIVHQTLVLIDTYHMPAAVNWHPLLYQLIDSLIIDIKKVEKEFFSLSVKFTSQPIAELGHCFS